MKKLQTILLLVLIASIYAIDRDTINVCGSKVIVNLEKIQAFNNDTTTKFVKWGYGYYRISETVIYKDSIYMGKFKYKYEIGDTVIYVNY